MARWRRVLPISRSGVGRGCPYRSSSSLTSRCCAFNSATPEAYGEGVTVSRDGLSANEARQTPIREDLPTRSAGGAIGDFVGLVGDPAEVVAAAGAGEAGAAVDYEAVGELGGEAAFALAL